MNFHIQWKEVLRARSCRQLAATDLRHGFASAAVGAGASLYAVGKQLGHAKPQTTARYAHVAESTRHDLTETVAALVLRVGANPRDEQKACTGGPASMDEIYRIPAKSVQKTA